jgi:GNAT superfamily N-acetyltransferase
MSDVRILTGYVPGVVGRVTELHATYYHRHWGFGAFFEAKVAAEMAEFIRRYDDSRDRIWCALVDGRIEAALTIDGSDAALAGAHLRWFIASDAVRGSGVGARLLGDAMRFCREARHARVYLWTFRGLEPARHLYEKAGFVLAETRAGTQWGTRVDEQRYEASLRVQS